MRIGLVIIGIVCSSILLGQAQTLEAALSKTTVYENEVFTYQITSYSDCEIVAPDFGELEVLGGPSTGYFTENSYINGVQKNSTRYTQTYTLRATQKGTYKISPARMKCKLKKEITSNETLTLKVIASTDAAPQETKSEHFLKLTTNKTSVYVGEPFVVTFRFYSPKKPNSIEAIELGNASGLERKDLDANRANYMMTQEIIKGTRYYILELKREVCIPLRSGKINIEPYYGSLTFQIDFFTNERQEGKSNSLEIDVKKIPGTLPENFNGLIGKFDFTQEIDKTNLIQGQVLEVNLKISGTGNLNSFDVPKLNLPDGFTQSDPEITDNTTISEQGFSGNLIYKFIVTADKPGDYELAPFSFSYFDLGDRTIKQLTGETFSVHVEKGDENHGAIFNTKQSVEIKDTDIHFIHPEKGISFSLSDFVFGTFPYIILLVGPIFLALLVVYSKRKKSNLSEEEKTEIKQKNARKEALKSFEKAQQLAKNKQEKEALKVVQNTLITYFITKLNLSLSSLSQRSITIELENRKIDNDLILEFAAIWKQVEMAQYAPISTENLNETISNAQKLIVNLNEKL